MWEKLIRWQIKVCFVQKSMHQQKTSILTSVYWGDCHFKHNSSNVMLETDYIECVIEFCFPLEAGMSALHHWEENSDTPVLWAKITPCNESEGIKISIFVDYLFLLMCVRGLCGVCGYAHVSKFRSGVGCLLLSFFILFLVLGSHWCWSSMFWLGWLTRTPRLWLFPALSSMCCGYSHLLSCFAFKWTFRIQIQVFMPSQQTPWANELFPKPTSSFFIVLYLDTWCPSF